MPGRQYHEGHCAGTGAGLYAIVFAAEGRSHLVSNTGSPIRTALQIESERVVCCGALSLGAQCAIEARVLKRLVNLPFALAGKAARAFQAREDAKIAAAHGQVEDPGKVANLAHALPVTHTDPDAVQISASALLGRAVHWVDVREAVERSEIIAGSVHMPVLAANVRVSELPPDETVVVVCDTGERSTRVACFFRDRGMEDTWALTGGLAAWKAAGGRVTPT